MNLPEWRTKRLEEILSPIQLRKVASIMNTTGDNVAKLKLLKAYLVQFQAELNAKDIDPNFLAYAILWKLSV